MSAPPVGSPSPLVSVHVVVTAGGTQQPLDDVRFIANTSTGRFGSRIAEECIRRGAHVSYVHGPGALLPFQRRLDVDLRAEPAAALQAVQALSFEQARGTAQAMEVRTVDDLLACLHPLLAAGDKKVIVHAMAVSDYSASSHAGKISSDQPELVIRLQRTPKVIAYLKEWAPSIVQVSFKLLSGVSRQQLYSAGLSHGQAYHSDLIVANDLREISAAAHPVLAIWPDGRSQYLDGDTPRLVVDCIEHILRQREEGDRR